MSSEISKMRLDKWLWAARFYKTRSLSVAEINRGRVTVNGQSAKPAREISAGDLIVIRKHDPATQVHVLALSHMRGPAVVARQLYQETPESIQAAEHAAEMRRMAPEPAHAIKAGRPTKRERRHLERFRRS